MQFGRFRIGLRTLKTALAVMIIITAFYFFHRPPLLLHWHLSLRYVKVGTKH